MATIELTSPEEVKAAQAVFATTDLFNNAFMLRFGKCRNDEQNTMGNLYARAKHLENDMNEFMASGNCIRIAELEEELTAVVAEGLQAERELERASIGVTEARKTNAALESWHSRASVALKTATVAPLGRFYTPADEQRKAQTIAVAEADMNECLNEMANNPLGVPIAIQKEQQAQIKVGKLAARAKALRSELATLTGKPTQATGTTASSTGLAG